MATVPFLRTRARGFTLIEAMAAVTVAGIVTAIALPSYRDAQLRSRRVDATQALQRLHAAQETHRMNHGRVATQLGQLPGGESGQSPMGRYRIELHPLGSDSYELVALAQGAQAADSECATLRLRVVGALSFQEPGPRCWHS